MNEIKKIEWKTLTGKKVTVTVGLKITKALGCMVTVRPEIEGISTDIGSGNPRRVSGLTNNCVATIGKLALNEENCKKVEDAIEDIKQQPAWIKEQEQIKAAQKTEKEAYANKKANGFCPRCQSYCFGDCQGQR